MRGFSARDEYADAWHAFLYPQDDTPGQVLSIPAEAARYPFRAQQGTIAITDVLVALQ